MNQYMKRGDLTDRILTWIQRHPSATNTQISKGIEAKPGAVATITNRSWKEGKLQRLSGEKKLKNGNMARAAYRYSINPQ